MAKPKTVEPSGAMASSSSGAALAFDSAANRQNRDPVMFLVNTSELFSCSGTEFPFMRNEASVAC